MSDPGDAHRLGRQPNAVEIIARLQWRVAKTMPEIPHQYTVRGKPPESEADYVALFQAIQASDVRQLYNGRRKPYLLPGDGMKYWAMTSHLPSSHVLNRMLIEDDLPRLRRERWLAKRARSARARSRRTGASWL